MGYSELRLRCSLIICGDFSAGTFLTLVTFLLAIDAIVPWSGVWTLGKIAFVLFPQLLILIANNFY